MLAMKWKLFIKVTKGFSNNNQNKMTAEIAMHMHDPALNDEAIKLKSNLAADWSSFSLPTPQCMLCQYCLLPYFCLSKRLTLEIIICLLSVWMNTETPIQAESFWACQVVSQGRCNSERKKHFAVGSFCTWWERIQVGSVWTSCGLKANVYFFTNYKLLIKWMNREWQ